MNQGIHQTQSMIQSLMSRSASMILSQENPRDPLARPQVLQARKVDWGPSWHALQKWQVHGSSGEGGGDGK